MKIEQYLSKVSEIFVENEDHSVTVTALSNGEGVNVMLHGKNLSPVLTGSMRWEEVDILVAALTLARSA